MDEKLKDELNYLIELSVKSGFYSEDEILEIVEDQFINEDIDISKIKIDLTSSDNHNFNLLDESFKELIKKNNILTVHNCGYDIEEGLADIFELNVHLKNNNIFPRGFCFYTFEDIEEAIFDNNLRLIFGDFDNNPNLALKIGNEIFNLLESKDFKLSWDKSLDNPIEIKSFIWDKSFDDNFDYTIEGVFDLYSDLV